MLILIHIETPNPLRWTTKLSELFHEWTDTPAFTRDVLKEFTRNSEVEDFKVLKEFTRNSEGKDFKRMTAVVEEIGERFGRFQNGKCQTMKSKLIKLGDQDWQQQCTISSTMKQKVVSAKPTT